MKKFYLVGGILLGICVTSSAQKIYSSISLHKTVPDSMKYFSLHALPSNYYSSKMGFFCKKEMQVQNAIKVPLRFRLGSVAYCDAMEGKSNTHP